MKKITITIMAVALLASGCSKSSSSSTTSTPTGASVSTLNITLAGHSYHLIYDKSVVPATATIFAWTSTAVTYTPPKFAVEVGGSRLSEITVSLMGLKADASTAIGTYYTAPMLAVTDYGDGGKKYSVDTTSTITVSASNSTEIKGTFNLRLFYNGSTSTATGDFDYKK